MIRVCLLTKKMKSLIPASQEKIDEVRQENAGKLRGIPFLTRFRFV